MLFANPEQCLPRESDTVANMKQDIGALGRAVEARRAELGLSQEEIGSTTGPSTTTLSKIELVKVDRVSRRTLQALDRALGWRAGSAWDVTYGLGPPRVAKPSAPERLAPIEEVLAQTADPDDEAWMTIRAGRDDRGVVVVGTSVSPADEVDGVTSRIEVRYWPGVSRTVQMASFPAAVVAAHEAAREATSIYREERAHGNPAATSQAGVSPVAEPSPEGGSGHLSVVPEAGDTSKPEEGLEDEPPPFKYPPDHEWTDDVQSNLDEHANAARRGEPHQKPDTTTGEESQLPPEDEDPV